MLKGHLFIVIKVTNLSDAVLVWLIFLSKQHVFAPDSMNHVTQGSI